jgi:mannose-6-phosphate isomerase
MNCDPNEYQREYLVSVGDRPWGFYVVLANELDVKVKKITVNPHHRLSLQRHQKRDEHWFIQKGQARVAIDGIERILAAGESIDIARGTTHRIGNDRDEPLVFIEVQTGEYFGEDDIERIEDDYQDSRG